MLNFKLPVTERLILYDLEFEIYLSLELAI